MELYEAIEKRHSIRQFTDEPIAAATVERILAAGLAAPSSNHQRRWELVALTDRERIEGLSKHIRNLPCRFKEPKSPQQQMMKIAYPRQRSMVAEAACIIAPYFKQKYPIGGEKGEWGLNDFGATWALIENMLLAATAEGLGSVVHVPMKKEPEEIRAYLGVPEGYYLPALVMLGHAATDAEVPEQVEATVEKKTHWNAW